MKYDIISGWYSDGAVRPYKVNGDDFVRSVECFYLWEWCIRRYTSPDQIYIVDSASPIVPELPVKSNMNWVRFSRNFGHAIKSKDTLSGWSRALLSGLLYSYCNGSDYAVLIEQGSLFYGPQIIENEIARHPDAGVIAPAGYGTPQPLQTGIMIFRTSIVPEFIARYAAIPQPDGGPNGISPEKKVHSAATGMNLALSDLRFGRSRPMNFDRDEMFVRHATATELQAFLQKVGLQAPPTRASLDAPQG
ncbi:hypothetical protein VQH23_24255 [Pararoseomonas sp. SCSIO 73927]|uniref:hypothetical protein n=1 Tax=Pararoseomonas sp. SCSIO 73927 TaxID=3114537 RepID=UPI0030D0E3C2